jgi:hypothetical protein
MWSLAFFIDAVIEGRPLFGFTAGPSLPSAAAESRAPCWFDEERFCAVGQTLSARSAQRSSRHAARVGRVPVEAAVVTCHSADLAAKIRYNCTAGAVWAFAEKGAWRKGSPIQLAHRKYSPWRHGATENSHAAAKNMAAVSSAGKTISEV